MIEGLKPYRGYKDSGVRWFGAIPQHWQIVPLCALGKPKSIVGKSERELLSVYLNRGVVRFTDVAEKRTNVTSEDLSKYQAVDPGDFVLNNQQAWRGSVGVSRHKGIVSPAYLVLSLDARINPEFADCLFRDRSMVDQYLVSSKGVGTIQRNLYWPHLKRASGLLPPLAEQELIVRFLNHADRRIRRYIGAKRRLIAILHERKQAIIQHAVAFGHRSPGTTKPLESIPGYVVNAEWNVVRLCDATRCRSEKNRPDLDLLSVFLDRGVIKYGDGGGQVHKPSLDLTGYQVVRPGDMVLNNQQAWRGSVGVSEYFGIISPAYIVLEPTVELDQRFGNYLIRSRLVVDQFVAASKGVGDIQRDIHTPWLRNVRIPMPTVEEQKLIAAKLDNELTQLNRDQLLLARETDLIQEYRVRLIADVVTGKLDVREAVNLLPTEGADRAPPNDPEELMSSEVAGNEIDDEVVEVET